MLPTIAVILNDPYSLMFLCSAVCMFVLHENISLVLIWLIRATTE